MKKKLFTAIALAVCLRAHSQDLPIGVIVSSGGSGSVDGIQLSWTVGEPFVGTLSSNAGSLAQGFFYQTRSLLTAVRAPDLAPEMRVFPNPATDRLTIEMPTPYGSYHLRVLDAVGRERVSEALTGISEKTLDISLLPSGAYYLQLRDAGNKTVKTFKLIILK
jgi:hypothetical protein